MEENQNIGKRIYLATPYSHEDKKIMQRRFELVTKVAAKLQKMVIMFILLLLADIYWPIKRNYQELINFGLIMIEHLLNCGQKNYLFY